MKPLKTSLILLFFLTLLLGVAYPILIWGIGQLFFDKEAEGTLIYRQGTIVGSSLIGQNFTSPKYFHPRPSSGGYNGASSGGSNLGPTSQKLIDDVNRRIAQLRLENNWEQEIPADAVMSSGSGLDPHISIAYARIQAERVAKSRNLDVSAIYALIDQHTEGAVWGLFGQKRVNVLTINLALENK